MIACKEALSGASYITAVSVLDLPIGLKIRRDADVAGIDCVDNGRRFRRGAVQYARLAVGPPDRPADRGSYAMVRSGAMTVVLLGSAVLYRREELVTMNGSL